MFRFRWWDREGLCQFRQLLLPFQRLQQELLMRLGTQAMLIVVHSFPEWVSCEVFPGSYPAFQPAIHPSSNSRNSPASAAYQLKAHSEPSSEGTERGLKRARAAKSKKSLASPGSQASQALRERAWKTFPWSEKESPLRLPQDKKRQLPSHIKSLFPSLVQSMVRSFFWNKSLFS